MYIFLDSFFIVIWNNSIIEIDTKITLNLNKKESIKRFFLFIISLMDKITWYLLLVESNRYLIELIEICENGSRYHNNLEMQRLSKITWPEKWIQNQILIRPDSPQPIVCPYPLLCFLFLSSLPKTLQKPPSNSGKILIFINFINFSKFLRHPFHYT